MSNAQSPRGSGDAQGSSESTEHVRQEHQDRGGLECAGRKRRGIDWSREGQEAQHAHEIRRNRGGLRTGNDDEGQGRVRKRCAILTESIVRHVDHAARRGGGTWVGVDCRFMQRRRLVLGRTLVWPEDGTAGRYRIPEMRNNTTGKVCFGRPFGGVERPMLPIPRRRELAGSEAEGRKRGEAGRDWTGGIQDQVWS